MHVPLAEVGMYRIGTTINFILPINVIIFQQLGDVISRRS